MSLFSRNTGGGRRVAKTAAIFAGTLLAYLVVAVVPAQAATTCAINGTFATQLDVSIGTDDTAALFSIGGVIDVLVNGSLVDACPAGATEAAILYIKVTGSNAGNETLVMWNPQNGLNGDNTSVDLGNGTDTLTWEYGNLGAPWALGDFAPGVGADAVIGTAASGVGVGDFDANGPADLRIDNAEINKLNGDTVGDHLDAGNLGGIAAFTFSCCGGADDIPGATAPFAHDLTLNGFNGDDLLNSGNGNDTFLGGPGSDTVSYDAASGPVVVDLTAGTGTGMGNDTLTDVQNAIGGDFDDTITGNALNNALSGGLGNDTVDGLAGDDAVSGGAGNDHLLGGDGLDAVAGGAGNDNIDEGAASNGADALSGGPDTDTLNYGARTTDTRAVASSANSGQISPAENDAVANDFEVYVTGSGNDVLGGDGTSETFRPQGGNDTVDGGGGTDTFDFVTGPVTVDLDAGTATGEGSDTFTSIESLDLTDGDDTVNWAGTVPLLNVAGGAGIDTINASAAVVAVSIDLGAFAPGDDVENAIGGSGSDELVGNVRNNVLTGNAGDDFIDGEDGNDTVEGGVGNDTLIGGNGADTLIYVHASSKEEIDTQLGFASGGDGEDSLAFFEIVKASDFADTITAGQNAFSLNNRIFGRGGKDNITGSSSSDLLVGGGADDTIRAGAGDDTLKGNAGNDLLVGGSGFDIGFGGKGKDTCKKVEQKHSC